MAVHIVWLMFAAMAMTGLATKSLAVEAIQYAAPERIAVLAEQQITESSGLAAARRNPGWLWTHNDSGDTPRMFAFDEQGKHRAVCRVTNARALDWEDMCSFQFQDQSWLLLADVGDNYRMRGTYQLYLVREPRAAQPAVDVHAVIQFRYPDGAHDCEAVAVDVADQKIFLLTKRVLASEVYQLPLTLTAPPEVLLAERVGRITLPLVTAADVSSDSKRMVVLTYGHAYQFRREEGETWRDALRKAPSEVTMPGRRQGETICYGLDGTTLYLTSEKLPTPLWKVHRADAGLAGQ